MDARSLGEIRETVNAITRAAANAVQAALNATPDDFALAPLAPPAPDEEPTA